MENHNVKNNYYTFNLAIMSKNNINTIKYLDKGHTDENNFLIAISLGDLKVIKHLDKGYEKVTYKKALITAIKKNI